MWTPGAAPDAPRRRRRRSWPHLLLAALLTLRGVPAAGQPPPAAPAGDEAIVTVFINGLPRGEFFGVRAGQDFWINAADLPRLRLVGAPVVPQGPFVSLRSLAPQAWKFDEDSLVLQLELPPDRLEGTHVDIGGTPARRIVAQAPLSLILSYRLSNRGAGNGRTTLAETDLNVRVGPVLLRQEARLELGSGQRNLVRGRTQAIVDQPAQARRWIAGDVLSSAGPYGSTITGAGVQLTKVWSMTPDAPRQPRASVRASTALPADVELQVDGATVFRGRVGPGPIELDNLQVPGGQRNLRLTVTDVSGRQQVIEQPFLAADTSLAAGVHDYTYFFGRRSELSADASWRYREGVAQAYHRYGLTDTVTVSAGGEANAEVGTAGAGVTLRLDRFGLVAVDRLTNWDRVAARRRDGWAGRYTFQTPQFSFLAGLRVFDAGFRSFAGVTGLFPTRERLLAVSRSFGPATASLEWARSESALETRASTALRVSANFGQSSLVSAELRAARINGMRDNRATLFWRTYLDRDTWVGGNVDASETGRALTLEAGRQVPTGEGFGYRASLTDASGGGVTTRTAGLAGTLNLPAAALDLAATRELGGRTSYTEVGVSGALVAIGGHVGVTRFVGDSFALARLGVPVAGVDVLLNSQLQGKTDARGELLIPNVAAFDRQEVSLVDQQIPMLYQLDRPTLGVSPGFRSGVIVDFALRPLQAVAGKAWRLQEGRRLPLAQLAWTMRGPSGTVPVATSGAGDFYIEKAEPGAYTGSLELEGRRLACRLEVPESKEPIQDLAEGIVCE